MLIIILIILFLCFGSFLNCVGFRLIHNYSILKPRSFCPNCKTTIEWYDLIPVISWFILFGKCRSCHKTISVLYPLIEIITAIVFTLLYLYIPSQYWLSYSMFFTALIITIRTDAETMLISRYTTIFLIPIGFLFAYTNLLFINLSQSILGVIFGYFILWFIAKIFFLIKKVEGIGEGDFELLATIGAFTGPIGVWLSLSLGAFLGSCLGIILLIKGKSRTTQIPFGPWLALGAIIYVFVQKYLILF